MIEKRQEPMSRHTTFRVGGEAAYYFVPESCEEIKEAVEFAKSKNLPYFILGNGSNLLVSDQGYEGVVIEIGSGLSDLEIREDGTVYAQAGIRLSQMASALQQAGWTGFEFASGIPGTLGGAVTMNAGAYGGEIRDVIVNATVLQEDGTVVVLDKEELALGYRTSVVQKGKMIVVAAEFAFEKGEPEQILAVMKDLLARRADKQPLNYPSAGSTFKRPEGHFAGKLIQDAGLRGYRVGDAQISEKHCGFVVNRGKATAADIWRLIQDVQQKVWDEFQVKLEPEVRMLGKF